MKRPHLRYEMDPHNRLVVAGGGRANDLPKFRKVLDGEFRTDRNNNLSYHIKAPLSEEENIPHQIRIRGRWSLTDDHDLRLTLDKEGRRTFGDQITLQGEILDVNAGSLLFAVTTKRKDNTQSVYVLNLGGSWQADKNNALSFHVKKEKGAHDILSFSLAWDINKNHQIIYQYEKARLIRKRREKRTLTFKGYWDIEDRMRLSYVLSKDTDSIFDFRTSVGIFKDDYIEYEIGVGVANRRDPLTRVVVLSGRWALKKDIGLIFEIEYGRGRTKEITFGADARLTGNDTVCFRLKNNIDNKDMGAELELSHRILKGGGEAFLRFLKSSRESAIYAGSAWRW